MEPTRLIRDENGAVKCPRCGETLIFVSAQPVQVVDGKLNMKDSQAHFKCENCNTVFRAIVNTDYYQCYTE